jgi:hypothetical protein
MPAVIIGRNCHVLIRIIFWSSNQKSGLSPLNEWYLKKGLPFYTQEIKSILPTFVHLLVR